ncbi:MAG: BamA/TamA family outer membrane protein [Bacteroidota bacterium]
MKNKYSYYNKPHNFIEVEEINSFLKQKPNRKILFFVKFHLGTYDLAHRLNKKERNKGILYWMENTVGEKPVVYSKFLANKSSIQIERYLFNKGFFNAQVYDTVVFQGENNKKATVIYVIDFDKPYKIAKLNYSINDYTIKSLVLNDSSQTLIKTGELYDAEKLENERLRILKTLQNNGYYGFLKDYIRFKVDSSFNNHTISIDLTINNKDTNELHKKYIFNTISIYPEYIPLVSDTIVFDTISESGYKFLVKGKRHFNYNQLAQSVFINNGSIFQQLKVSQTYNRLSDLKTFRYINLTYKETGQKNESGYEKLDVYIQLTPVKFQSYSLETEGTNSAGRLGIGGNLLYQHRNLFKGLEQFNIKIRGALEYESVKVVKDQKISYIPFFNTYEYGIDGSVVFPKFFAPLFSSKAKSKLPKTVLSMGYNFQFRSEYNRSIFNINYGCEWKDGTTQTHVLNPIEYNYVRIAKDSIYNSIIAATNNPTIINSYKSHLIPGIKYSYIFNNQNTRKGRSFVYFRGNLEASGNILHLISPMIKLPQTNDGNYELFNIRFSQFIRPSIDVIKFTVFDPNSQFATRFMFGIGVPYDNSNALPFEKSFYAGGANGMRAWKIYELGPGSNNEKGFSTKTGDMQLETNWEYRYTWYKKLKGALFFDAGNIWMVNKADDRLGADFDFTRFYKEIAIDGGLGLRYDFSYFVIRLDAAVKLRNPSLPEENRWVFDKIRLKAINYNIGIGYPF